MVHFPSFRPFPALAATLVLVGACSSSSSGGSSNGGCFPDGDGLNGGSYTFDLTVDDTGFSKNILATQNDSQVTVHVTNNGTKPHGFTVGCTNVANAYPDLPAGCPSKACFPAGATLAPLMPGASGSVTFVTPTPDNLVYPFSSNAPGDADVAGLQNGQWTLM